MKKNKLKSNIGLTILLTILIIAVLGFGGYFVWKIESGENNNQTASSSQTTESNQNIQNEKNEESTEKQEPEPSETKEEFVNSCATYTFKELARNPNNYVGKRAKFTGEVIQVQEEDGVIAIRLNVTKDEYGYYDDTIMVGYKYKDPNESKILEKDIITVYGELKGNTSYTSVLGAEITLPLMLATYIDIK